MESSAAVVAPARCRWRVLDNRSAPVASGRFAHAFPPVVPPGGTVLFIDTVSATFAEADQIARLDAAIFAEPATTDDAVVSLRVSMVTWRSSEEGGVEVSGRVENPTSATVNDVMVGIVLRDRTGQILGGLYDIGLPSIEPGAGTTFVTDYPGAPPMAVEDIVTADGIASGTR